MHAFRQEVRPGAWYRVLRGTLVAVKADASAPQAPLASRSPPLGTTYTVTSIQDEYSTDIYRRIDGVMTVPSYMSGLGPNTVLVLDPVTGEPVYQENDEVEFTVLIPRSLVESGQPGAILQYGHGLLGGKGEVTTGYLQTIANRWGYVLVAVDWLGMCSEDVPAIVLMMLTST